MRGVPHELDRAQLYYHTLPSTGWVLRYFDGAGHVQTLPVSESKDATPRELAAAVEAAIGVDSKLTGTIRIYIGDTLRGTIRLSYGEAKSWRAA